MSLRISFQRTGGFAAIRLTTQLDAASLPPDEAHRLEKLVHEADFFNLPAATAPSRRGADRFQYVLTVEMDGKRHTVRISEEAVSERLQRLIDYLTRAAKGAGP